MFEKQCSIEKSGSVCAHIREFYSTIISKSPDIVIYWEFPVTGLPEVCTFAQEDSLTGDVCHYVISGINDRIAKDMLPKNLDSITFCDANNTPRMLTLDDMEPYCRIDKSVI